MTTNAEIFGSTIVALGSFNPAIFSPDWFEKNQLIGTQDADVARQFPNLIVSHQVTSFETEWFGLQVLENRFTLTSKAAVTPAFRDLALGIFTVLSQTPVSALGLNFAGHYKIKDAADYHKIGDVFAPKDIWNELFPPDKNACGLANLTIRVQYAPRGTAPENGDQANITLAPSTLVNQGVAWTYNDHYEVSGDKDRNMTSAECAAEIIKDKWEGSWQNSIKVFEHLLEKALQAS